MLLDGGIDTNVLDNDGRTALHIAIFAGQQKIVRLLEKADR